MDEQKLEELLHEELTGEELRELLERLGAEEFGGSENSRLRDVVELTGQEPLSVARVLADIRKEDWEERFGSILEDHSERIERLERRPSTKAVGGFQPPTPDPELSRRYDWRTGVDADRERRYDDPYLQEARDRIEQAHAIRPYVLGLLALMWIIFLFSTGGNCFGSTAPSGTNRPGTYDNVPSYSVEEDGKMRPATPDEVAAFEAAKIRARQQDRR